MSARADLALCLRMLEAQGIVEYNGHASVRDGQGMWINAGSAARSRLTEGDICRIDLAGNVLEGDGKPPLEFHLHAGIYRARPDVQAVIHAHPRWSTYLTTAGKSYQPVFAQGAILDPVPLLLSPDSINSREMGEMLAGVLGDRPAALMMAHGAVTVGASLTEAFALMNYLEENAQRQYRALTIGAPFVFSEAQIEAARAKLWNPGLFARTWAHFAAKLEG